MQGRKIKTIRKREQESQPFDVNQLERLRCSFQPIRFERAGTKYRELLRLVHCPLHLQQWNVPSLGQSQLEEVPCSSYWYVFVDIRRILQVSSAMWTTMKERYSDHETVLANVPHITNRTHYRSMRVLTVPGVIRFLLFHFQRTSVREEKKDLAVRLYHLLCRKR